VLGGLEKEFPPLKTRLARKLEKDKGSVGEEKVLISEGPWALRD
jgi:hypothetical protein